MKKPGKGRKKRAKPYTMGELNKLVDDVLHPLSKTDKGYWFLDGVLHGLIEQDPSLTVRKFVKYNLPKIMKQLEKEAENNP